MSTVTRGLTAKERGYGRSCHDVVLTVTPEEKREYDRLRWERDRERLRQQQREKYARNRDKYREQRREYREQNKDKLRAQKAAYYQRNRSEIRRRAAAYRQQNPDKAREADLKKNHGMRLEDRDAMWVAQGGRCYLCGNQLDPENSKRVHVDHDHSCCGKERSCRICRRGLACEECNKAIGMAHDDPSRLRRMADALEAAQMLVTQRKAAAPRQEQLSLTAP